MSQEPLETTEPVVLHEADTPEETPDEINGTDIWSAVADETTAGGTGE